MLDWGNMPPRRAVVFVSARLAPDLAARISDAARRSGLSQNAWIERALALQVLHEDEAISLETFAQKHGLPSSGEASKTDPE